MRNVKTYKIILEAPETEESARTVVQMVRGGGLVPHVTNPHVLRRVLELLTDEELDQMEWVVEGKSYTKEELLTLNAQDIFDPACKSY